MGQAWNWWGLSPEELLIAARLPWRDQALLGACGLLEPALVAQYLVELAEHLGLLTVARSLGVFTEDELMCALAGRETYQLGDPVRKRMLSAITAGLAELGVLEAHGDRWCTARAMPDLPVSVRAQAEGLLGTHLYQELAFDRARPFLQGSDAPITFGQAHGAWLDRVLDRAVAQLTKALAAHTLGLPRRRGQRILELCFGRGHGLVHLLTTHPVAEVVALDYTDAHVVSAAERVRSRVPDALERLQFVPAKQWEANGVSGFGAPLPFQDGEFDSIFMSLADAYIPAHMSTPPQGGDRHRAPLAGDSCRLPTAMRSGGVSGGLVS